MIKLGDEARDIITGFTGIVVARIENISGEWQYKLQPQKLDHGNMLKEAWVTEALCEFVSEGIHAKPIIRELGFKR